MPPAEVVLAAFSESSLPCRFFVAAPRSHPGLDAGSSSAGIDPITIKVFNTGQRGMLSWEGKLQYSLKPKAVKKKERDFLTDLLTILQHGSGDGSGQSQSREAIATRKRFITTLEDATDTDKRAKLRVTIRGAGVTYAEVPLARLQTRAHLAFFNDIAFTQWKQQQEQEQIKSRIDELAAQVTSAQQVSQAALAAKEDAENQLLSKFVQILNQKKLKIRELWEKINQLSSGELSHAGVPQLNDRHLSLRGSTKHIDDSDEGSGADTEDNDGDDDDDDDDESSEDLAQSITGTYNSLTESQRSQGGTARARASAARAARKKSTEPASQPKVKKEPKAKESSAVDDILRSALSSESDSDNDMEQAMLRRRKRKLAQTSRRPAASKSVTTPPPSQKNRYKVKREPPRSTATRNSSQASQSQSQARRSQASSSSERGSASSRHVTEAKTASNSASSRVSTSTITPTPDDQQTNGDDDDDSSMSDDFADLL